jgi:hypothetical protein
MAAVEVALYDNVHPSATFYPFKRWEVGGEETDKE